MCARHCGMCFAQTGMLQILLSVRPTSRHTYAYGRFSIKLGMSPLVETLQALAATFAKLRVRWYLFGAQAAIFHGVARATADIDVTVDPGRSTTLKIARALAGSGFSLRVTDPAFVKQTRVLPVTHHSGVPVDVVLAGPGLEELFFERTVQRRIGKMVVPVASAEDLIVMKLLAGRSKDHEDIRGILSANASLNMDQVRETLRLLEAALAQTDLLSTLEALRRPPRARSMRRRAKPK